METARNNDVSLAQTLGFFDATMIGVGAMIGAGIFVLTGIAAGEAGPAAILAFALNGLVTLITAASYARLGAAIPEAGGGYTFVQRAFPGLMGFVAGWVLWFAYMVACALYAVGFGGYSLELAHSYFPEIAAALEGLVGRGGAVGIATVGISALFVSLNVAGAAVTGKAENVLTMAKIVVLGVFVAFGLSAIGGEPALLRSNFVPLLPKGWGGVAVAMGLTFIAFEGYDLIATVSEEIKNPKENIPKATYVSLAIAVSIYLLVIVVSIGAVDVSSFADIVGKEPAELAIPNAQVLDPSDPEIDTAWEILGTFKETGIVRAAESFMPAIGVLLIVVGGLLSTMSALNATVLASSRVAFSMGRQRMLPPQLGIIHPVRRTPHIAVLVTGVLVTLMAVALPIETVGSAASLLFLLSFALVNASLISLGQSMPQVRTPLFPWLPMAGIVINLALAAYQLVFQPMAWAISVGWIALGVVLYYSHARKQVAPEVPAPILMEEVLTSRGYTVMVPVRNRSQARLLGILGSAIACEQEGEVLALNVITVPSQLSLAEGRRYLESGRVLMETVIAEAKQRDVPVRTMLRVGRNVRQVIEMTVKERAVDLMLLGWPGYSYADEAPLGSVIGSLAANPPCDLAVIRFRQRELPERILVSTTGGPHATLALQLANSQGRCFEIRHGRSPTITLFSVVSPELGEAGLSKARARLQRLARDQGLEVDIKVTAHADEYQAILDEAQLHNLVIVPAPRSGLLEQQLFGHIPQRLAGECPKTVIMVKRKLPVQSWLARWFGGGSTTGIPPSEVTRTSSESPPPR